MNVKQGLLKKSIFAVSLVLLMITAACGRKTANEIEIPSIPTPMSALTVTPTSAPTATPKATVTLIPTSVPTVTPKATVTLIPTSAPTEVPVRTISLLSNITINSDYKDEWIEDAGAFIYYGSYNTIELTNEDASQYNKLAGSLNKRNTEVQQEFTAISEEFIAQNLAFMKDYPEMDTQTYEADISITLRRADSRVFSYLQQYYEFCGGAHGNYYYEGKNYSTQDGSFLKLSEVITDTSKLPGILEELIISKYPDQVFFNLKDTFKDYLIADKDGGMFSWTLDYQGVTFYFSPYEISSYAAGLLTVMLPFSSAPDFFNEDFMAVPENYTIQMECFTPIDYDLDGDGKAETVSVSGKFGDYDAYETLIVQADEATYETNLFAYDYTSFLLHTKDYGDCIYVTTIADDGWGVLYPFQVGPDGIRNSGEMQGFVLENSMVLDPESFHMKTGIDLLSTSFGYATYHVGEYGLPVREEDYYTIYSYSSDYPLILTSLIDLTVASIDDNNNVIEENIWMPAGTEFKLYRSDGNTYVDAVNSEGTICRIFVENVDSWPHMVNGVNIEECFDGINFAG